jgi:hypothetical protein
MSQPLLPPTTQPCCKCGALMVPAWTGAMALSSPPKHQWEWWCGCGHREPGGYVDVKHEESDTHRHWEAVNRPKGEIGMADMTGGVVHLPLNSTE